MPRRWRYLWWFGYCDFYDTRFSPDKVNIGLIYGKAHLFIVTILAIIFTAIWSALVTYGIIKVIAHYMPLRVSDRDEAIGLDDCDTKRQPIQPLWA